MNLPELKAALEKADIAERAYSFTSDGSGEAYRVQHMQDILGEGWEVYYSEGGNKNDLLIFRSEAGPARNSFAGYCAIQHPAVLLTRRKLERNEDQIAQPTACTGRGD